MAGEGAAAGVAGDWLLLGPARFTMPNEKSVFRAGLTMRREARATPTGHCRDLEGTPWEKIDCMRESMMMMMPKVMKPKTKLQLCMCNEIHMHASVHMRRNVAKTEVAEGRGRQSQARSMADGQGKAAASGSPRVTHVGAYVRKMMSSPRNMSFLFAATMNPKRWARLPRTFRRSWIKKNRKILDNLHEAMDKQLDDFFGLPGDKAGTGNEPGARPAPAQPPDSPAKSAKRRVKFSASPTPMGLRSAERDGKRSSRAINAFSPDAK